jgi:hypothetical protein
VSVYVAVDVHRKRSQVAGVEEDGVVRVNGRVQRGRDARLHTDPFSTSRLKSGTTYSWRGRMGRARHGEVRH